MSLVITSNTSLENTPEFSQAFKPYSYQNRLLNTMRIPPNSEIALESAKINKNGIFVLTRDNSQFAHYFGVPVGTGISDLGDIALEGTTTPFIATIGAGEAFRSGAERNEVSVDDMAAEIQKGINQAAFHPSLITGTNTTSIAVTTKYDGTTNDFEGFKFVTTQQTAKTTRNAASISFTDISKNNAYNFNQNNGTVTTTDTNGFYVQNREYPISQNEGTCTMNFSDANIGNWMVGLSRINKPRDAGAGDYDYLPTYYNTEVPANLNGGLVTRGQLRYADICVLRSTVGGTPTLRVFQSGNRSGSGDGTGIIMNEVIYYGAHNANFAAAYDIGTNADEYRKVKFTLNNEELKIELISSDGGTVLLCDYTTLKAAGATKNEFLNPVNAAKWAMYPVCAASGNFAQGARSITLESIDHYATYPTYNENTYANYDWWGWSQTYNNTSYCKTLEQRRWNDFSVANELAPAKVNASGGMEDYDSIIITAKDKEYEADVGHFEQLNTQFILGFTGLPISVPTSSTNLGTTNESVTVPKLTAPISLFVRLNNFTQNSVNARQGTVSKIVAHLPRFDNSGNETGGLFFQPNTPTYIALNNPTELLINSFDVDIVYENETLCTALSGKTIICFHIRKALN